MYKTLLIFVIIFLLLNDIECKGRKGKKKKKKTTAKPLSTCRLLSSRKAFSATVQREVDEFQRGWLDTDRSRFPRTSLTGKQALYLQTLQVKPPPAPSTARAKRARNRNKAKAAPIFCPGIKGPMRKRIEYRQLTLADRISFHDALNSMKTFKPDPADISLYDIFVRWHRSQNSPGAHRGPAFLPWHRELLLLFENALYDRGYKGPGLPYWDSTLDQSLPSPADSMLWTMHYMGNNFGEVASGPASQWDAISGCDPKLKRNAIQGALGKNYLFTDDDLNYVFLKNCYKDITYPGNPKFESDHGAVHVFVGEHMRDINCAPADPIFFLHHAFIDCIWEEFRQKHQESDRTQEYPQGGSVNTYHRWNANMKPFPGIINVHGLSNHYTQYYYECKPWPRRCEEQDDCESKALWCDTSTCRCRAKVRTGGDCTGLPNHACQDCKSPVFVAQCILNKCVCAPPLASDKAKYILVGGVLVHKLLVKIG